MEVKVIVGASLKIQLFSVRMIPYKSDKNSQYTGCVYLNLRIYQMCVS